MRRLRPSELTAALAATVEAVTAVHVDLDELLDRLDESCGGLRGRAATDYGRPSRSTASPTERDALRHDPARVDLDRLAVLVAEIHARAADLQSIFDRWVAPSKRGARRPTAHRQPAVRWCVVMQRVGVQEPAQSITDVGGILPEPVALSLWAQRWVRKHRRLPTNAEAQAHAEGRRVRAAS